VPTPAPVVERAGFRSCERDQVPIELTAAWAADHVSGLLRIGAIAAKFLPDRFGIGEHVRCDRERAHAAEKQRVAVGRGLRHRFRAEQAADPRPVSMMTGWPRPSENFCTTTRATLSLAPPGGNGTIRRIGAARIVCACRSEAQAKSASAHPIRATHAAKRTGPMITIFHC